MMTVDRVLCIYEIHTYAGETSYELIKVFTNGDISAEESLEKYPSSRYVSVVREIENTF